MTLFMSIVHSDPLPPPTNVQLFDVNSEQLIFNWSPAESNCSTLQYSIESDCGTFTTAVTTSTQATCSVDLSAIADSMCTFAIRSVVCGNISGILSDPLSITLKVTVYIYVVIDIKLCVFISTSPTVASDLRCHTSLHVKQVDSTGHQLY